MSQKRQIVPITPEVYERSLDGLLKPLAHWLNDDRVSEIVINGASSVFVDLGTGGLTAVDARFRGAAELMALAQGIAQYMGVNISAQQPHLDGRLPDGSRVHIVIPPVARKGLQMSILKPPPESLSLEKLVSNGSLTHKMMDCLHNYVVSRRNILISGGRGVGKTTLIRALSGILGPQERVIVVEDVPELNLARSHSVYLQANSGAKGNGMAQAQYQALLESSLRLRPDRLVIGDLGSPAVYSMLQTMAYGCSGVLSSLRALSPEGALRRLESLVLTSGYTLPLELLREQIVEAIHVIVQLERIQDGRRRVNKIVAIDDWNPTDGYKLSLLHKM